MLMVGMPGPFTGRHGNRNQRNHYWKIRGNCIIQRKISALATTWRHKMPDKLKELQDLFMKEAEKYHVLPIDDRLLERMDAQTLDVPR